MFRETNSTRLFLADFEAPDISGMDAMMVLFTGAKSIPNKKKKTYRFMLLATSLAEAEQKAKRIPEEYKQAVRQELRDEGETEEEIKEEEALYTLTNCHVYPVDYVPIPVEE